MEEGPETDIHLYLVRKHPRKYQIERHQATMGFIDFAFKYTYPPTTDCEMLTKDRIIRMNCKDERKTPK